MEERAIDQLCYTWSDVGLGNMSFGHRVRAASSGLQNIHGERYRDIDRYLHYQLPPDINPNTLSALDTPISLSFIETDKERLLVYKTYKGRDARGRPGLYFTHLLAGLPQKVSVREAILLWHAQNLWITAENQLDPRQVLLPQLSVDDLDKQQQLAWNTFKLAPLQDAMQLALAYFLQPSSSKRLYLSGSSEAIATIIWGITQSLPRTLLRGITFSTYDHNPTASKVTVTGIFSEQYVPPLSSGTAFINVDTTSEPLPMLVETPARQYIDFVVYILRQRHLQALKDDQLYRFIALAERQPVHNTTELFTLFQRTFHKQPSYPSAVPVTYPSKEAPVSVRADNVHEVIEPLRPPRRQRSILAMASQFQSELEHVRGQRTIYYGVRLSLLLNVALFLCLLAFLIFLPFNQNAVRQGVTNSVLAQLTQVARATQTSQVPLIGNSVNFLATSAGVVPLASINQPFVLFVEVENTGLNTWVPSKGYQLDCVPDPAGQASDQDCPQARPMSKVTTSVSTGQHYIFAFLFRSPGPAAMHHIKVQLYQDMKPFTSPSQPPYKLYFTIVSSGGKKGKS